MRIPSVQITWKAKLRYRFDDLMARGVGAQILLLVVLSAVLVLVVGFAAALVSDGPSFGAGLWAAINSTLDAGNLSGTEGSGALIAAMAIGTLGGIFVLSALIGVLNNGLGGLLEKLRQGRSVVVEEGHIVILGYGSRIPTLLAELAEANSNQPNACVVILSTRDKVSMDDEVRELGHSLRVVTRSGDPSRPADLEIARLESARTVIVLAPDDVPASEADTVVLKTLLAVSKPYGPGQYPFHIVAELQEERTLAVARMVTGPEAALVLAPPLVSRLLVQTGRQSGLSVVYTELLDFAGDEIYVTPIPSLEGLTFREALSAFEDSTLMGVVTLDDRVLLPPPMDRPFGPGDRAIAVSHDDDTLVRNGRGSRGASAPPPLPAPAGSDRPKPERALILGASTRLPLVLSELDAYVVAGSEVVIVGDESTGLLSRAGSMAKGLRHMRATFRVGDVTDRAVLDALNVVQFDHVLVLSEPEGRGQEVADARTMITLLHLRDIESRSGGRIQVTSEILSPENRELAAVAEADDFVVSNTMVSLVLSQVAEGRHLIRIFDELFRPEGFEIYLKPASWYVPPGVELDFYALVEAAARRGEVALGYRVLARASDANAGYGVTLNPKKSERVILGPDDKLVVLAEDGGRPKVPEDSARPRLPRPSAAPTTVTARP